jgi:hypothetical protein
MSTVRNVPRYVAQAALATTLLTLSSQATAFEIYKRAWVDITANLDGTHNSQISAADTSQNINILQLSATAKESSPTLGFGANLPWGLIVEYTNYNQQASHLIRGSQLSTRCFRIGFKTFCAGLTTTRDGDINWSIKHNKLSLLKKAIDTDTWNIYLGAGADFMSGTMTLVSSGTSETASGAIPLPFFAAGIDWRFASRTYVTSRIHYVNLAKSGTGYTNTMIEAEIKRLVTKNLSASVGIRQSITEFDYSSSSQISSLDWKGQTIYLKVTAGY